MMATKRGFVHAKKDVKRPEVDPSRLASFAEAAETRGLDIAGVGTEQRNSGATEPQNAAIPSKKLTVVLDRDRWAALRQQCTEEDRSAQKIFVDALDMYFASRRK